MSGPAIRALTHGIGEARDPQIMRIVAMVDAMGNRGSADGLIAPLRQRLVKLRPPRPLRFNRLLFQPLDLLIVSPVRWRPEERAIPRSVIIPIADHVRLMMGSAVAAIEAEINGRTCADIVLIGRVGATLWPAAAEVLSGAAVPAAWDATGLDEALYRPLADGVAALLANVPELDRLCAEAATGLLPTQPEAVAGLLGRVTRSSAAALPMMLALLLERMPATIELLQQAQVRQDPMAPQPMVDAAADLLLAKVDDDGWVQRHIGGGSLADAGAMVGRLTSLVRQLEGAPSKPDRRTRLRAVRQRLDANCKARFAAGLQDGLLGSLLMVDDTSQPAAITALETTARELRVLETEARTAGSGSTYDLLLAKAVEAITGEAMRGRLGTVDQLRLVEILAGPEAAVAMLT